MAWKKWLWRTLMAVFLTVVARTVWLVGEREWRRAEGEREFAAAVAETERTDPDWQWAPLCANRPRPPAGKNVAVLIPRIKELYPSNWTHTLDGQEWQPLLAVSANTRYPAKVIDRAKQDLALARPAVELARSLKDYPSGHRDIQLKNDVISTLLPEAQYTAEIARLLRWEVVLAVEAGNRNRTADDLTAMLNASRSIGDEPFLISQLIRIASRSVATRSLERALAQLELPAERAASLQAAWAADAEEPILLHGLRGERAAYDILMRNVIDGTVSPAEVAGTDPPSGLSFGDYAWWLYRGKLTRDRAYYHRYLTRAVDIARLPIHDQPQAMSSLPELPSEDLRFARLFLPAVEKVAASYWRNVAETRCAVVGLACERFRQRHSHWPANLGDLCPDYLPAIPLDPFDAQPLRLRKLDNGVVIFSVGQDRTDDGGRLSRPDDANGTDEGFRLWDLAHRRQPAPPQPVEEQPAP